MAKDKSIGVMIEKFMKFIDSGNMKVGGDLHARRSVETGDFTKTKDEVEVKEGYDPAVAPDGRTMQSIVSRLILNQGASDIRGYGCNFYAHESIVQNHGAFGQPTRRFYADLPPYSEIDPRQQGSVNNGIRFFNSKPYYDENTGDEFPFALLGVPPPHSYFMYVREGFIPITARNAGLYYDGSSDEEAAPSPGAAATQPRGISSFFAPTAIGNNVSSLHIGPNIDDEFEPVLGRYLFETQNEEARPAAIGADNHNHWQIPHPQFFDDDEEYLGPRAVDSALE